LFICLSKLCRTTFLRVLISGTVSILWYNRTVILSIQPSFIDLDIRVIVTINMNKGAPTGASPLACWKTKEVIFPQLTANTSPMVIVLPTFRLDSYSEPGDPLKVQDIFLNFYGFWCSFSRGIWICYWF